MNHRKAKRDSRSRDPRGLTLATPLEPGLSVESLGGVVVKTKGGGGGERSSGLDSVGGEGASDSGGEGPSDSDGGGGESPNSAGGADVKLSSSKPDIISTSLATAYFLGYMYNHFLIVSHLQLDRFQPKTILSRSNTMRYPDKKFSVNTQTYNTFNTNFLSSSLSASAPCSKYVKRKLSIGDTYVQKC